MVSGPEKTGGRMLQSEQATAGDREQLNRATMAQGQMALSAAAQISEQIRQQQEFTLRAQEGKQRSAMLAVKQQLFQQQLQNAGAILQLKQQQSQAQMMQAEASRMRAELEGQQQIDTRFKTFGAYKRPDGSVILPDDVRKGTYRVGRMDNPEDAKFAGILNQRLREKDVGKPKGPSVTKMVNDLMDRTKLGSRAAKTPLEALEQLAQRNGIDDNAIGARAQQIGAGQFSREQAIIDLLLERDFTR